MTDYIELLLDVAAEEEERASLVWNEGRAHRASGSWRTAGSAATGLYYARAGDGDTRSNADEVRDSAAVGGAMARSLDGGRTWDEPGGWRTEGDPVTRRAAAWGHAALSKDGDDAAGADAACGGVPAGETETWAAKTGAVRVYAALRRTAEAVSGVERRGAAVRIAAETEHVSVPPVDPAELDLIYQRDARRYDGAFALY